MARIQALSQPKHRKPKNTKVLLIDPDPKLKPNSLTKS